MRALVVLLLMSLALPASAQFSGGSFGGSRGFGGSSSSSSSSSWSSSSSSSSSSSWGSSSSSSWGSSSGSSSSGPSAAELARQAREAEARARRAREEAERQRQAAEAARRLAEDRALPPEERARLARRFETIPLGATHYGPLPDPTAGEVEAPEPPTPDWNAERASRVFSHYEDLEPNWGAGALVSLLSLLPLMFLGSLVRSYRRDLQVRRRALQELRQRGPARGAGRCEIRRISIAFDAGARARLQAQLQALGRQHDTSSELGMHAATLGTLHLLRSALTSARGAVWSSQRTSQSGAESLFFRIASDLEARFRHDVMRGQKVTAKAHAEEGEGYVVVSVVMGTIVPMRPTLPGQLTPATLHRALELMCEARELVAVKVIWSPAVEADRMSSLELRTLYPEVLPLGGAALGGRQCGYCKAVHTVELTRCPACGAPSHDPARQQA